MSTGQSSRINSLYRLLWFNGQSFNALNGLQDEIFKDSAIRLSNIFRFINKVGRV